MIDEDALKLAMLPLVGDADQEKEAIKNVMALIDPIIEQLDDALAELDDCKSILIPDAYAQGREEAYEDMRDET
jgi:hypothetical protein